MQFGGRTIHCAILGVVVSCAITIVPFTVGQQGTEAPAGAAAVIKTQTRLVLVDTVVTDKKGNYIRDLTAHDFRVWEDNKEQAITSFSFEDESASPGKPQRRYFVLFFDNSTMDIGDQVKARQAAAKFIDANAGPNHVMAVVNFGGTLQIAQNFTADADRLKQVVSGVKMSAVSPNAAPVQVATLSSPPTDLGYPNLSNAEAEFGVQTAMLSLRALVRNLGSVPGRKTLILLTAGFPLTAERSSEVTAVIDACNKANVAIYPVDVRGLVVSAFGAPSRPRPSLQATRLIPA